MVEFLKNLVGKLEVKPIVLRRKTRVGTVFHPVGRNHGKDGKSAFGHGAEGDLVAGAKVRCGVYPSKSSPGFQS